MRKVTGASWIPNFITEILTVVLTGAVINGGFVNKVPDLERKYIDFNFYYVPTLPFDVNKIPEINFRYLLYLPWLA